MRKVKGKRKNRKGKQADNKSTTLKEATLKLKPHQIKKILRGIKDAG